MRYPYLIVLLWLAVYVPRLSTLGFYHDDWWSLVEFTTGTAPWSFARLARYMDPTLGFASRPVLGFICYVVTSIAGSNPFAWQLFMALTILGAALLLRNLFCSQRQPFGFNSVIAGDAAAALWLLAPWQMGATCWPIMSGVLFCVLFLLLAVSRLDLSSPRLGPAALFGGLLAFSFLTYEAFYFVWILFVLLMATLRWPQVQVKALLQILGVGTAVQLAAIGFNRWIKHLDPATAKSAYDGYAALLARNVAALPSAVHESVAEVYPLFAYSFGALVVILTLGLAAQRDQPLVSRTSRLLAILGFYGGATIVSFFLYSLIGYGIASVGMQSRTLLPFTVITAITLGTWIGISPQKGILRFSLPVPLLCLFISLGFASQNRLADWQEAWRQESEVLSNVPADKLKAVGPKDAVLFIGPDWVNKVVVFGAQWDMTGAVNSLPPFRQRPRAFEGLIQLHPATKLYHWEYKDGVLTQVITPTASYRFELEKLYIWDFNKPPAESFYRAADGFELHPPR